jgi:glycerol-3-phosphate acyltransferase PlsY
MALVASLNMTLPHYLISFVLAYLLGSLPWGYWIGKIFFKKDLLKEGSGNIGTTNTFRILGPKAGLVVMILDILKGTFGGFMANIWGSAPNHNWIMLVGLGAILGHTFSFWIGFKGGKAVATSAGVLLAYAPAFFWLAFGIFLLMIFLTSMVSVASMVGFSIITIVALVMQQWVLGVIAIVLTVFVFYRHRANIGRIKNGTESLVPFGLVYWAKQKKS